MRDRCTDRETARDGKTKEGRDGERKREWGMVKGARAREEEMAWRY